MSIVAAGDVTRNEEEGWRQWCAGARRPIFRMQRSIRRCRRDTADIISIFYNSICACSFNFIKIESYECSSRRKYLFIIFFLSWARSAKKALFTVTPTRSFVSRGRTVSPTQARVHTHHLFYKPRVFLDVQCMYIKILSLTWFRHIKWGETSRNLPFVFSETLAMGQKRFAREMKYWRRPSYASFTICLWNVPDTTRCLFWIYRSHIGNFHIFVRSLVNSNKS